MLAHENSLTRSNIPEISLANSRSSPLARSFLVALRAMGWDIKDRDLPELIPSTKNSFADIDQLKEAASRLNLICQSQLISPDRIEEHDLPAIFSDQKGSLFVILEAGSEGLKIYDSLKHVTIEKVTPNSHLIRVLTFARRSNQLLTIDDPQRDWFWTLFRRFRQPVTAAFFLSFLLSILALVTPLFVRMLLGEVSPVGESEHWGAVLAGVGIYVFALSRLRNLRADLIGTMGARLSQIVRAQVLRRILLLPPSYTEMASLGSQMARIRDFDSIEDFVTGSGGLALLELPFLPILISGVFILGGSLGFIPLAAMVLFVLFGIVMARLISLANAASAQGGKELQDFKIATLTNLWHIRSLHLGRYWSNRFDELLRQSLGANTKISNLTSLVSAVSYGLVAATGLTTLAIGVQLIMVNKLSPGSLMAAMLLTWRTLAPLKSGFMVAVQLSKVQKSVGQIDRLMALPIEERNERFLRQHDLQGKITFSQVSLRYSKDAHPALLGINLELLPRQTLVIIGHGGCGKTSLLKLLLGMYAPQTGRIMLDDMNIKQFDQGFLRKSLGYMPQSPTFIEGTIHENLLLANPFPSSQIYDSAILESGLLDDLRRLKKGVETHLSDLDQNQFSESLLKKLNLAMMLIKDTNVWLMDQPSTGLDDIGERQLLSFLGAVRGQVTIIISTQNPDYFQVADQVLWLNDGRVKALARPAELADQFKRIVLKQA